MNTIIENIFLISSIAGILISFIMLAQVVRGKKADFFMGLVVFMMGIELLFSWGVRSGYVNSPNAIPYWRLLNYLIFPPAIWFFIKYTTDDNFQFKSWHLFLFIPAVIAYILDAWSGTNAISLIDYKAWLWFTDYLPLIATAITLVYFWVNYFKIYPLLTSKSKKQAHIKNLRLLLIMGSLSLICIMWFVFNLIGWGYYEYIEFTLIFLFLSFTFLNFIENQRFPKMTSNESLEKFQNYDDKESLSHLDNFMNLNKPYLSPNFPLKELAGQIGLPVNYLSFLINHYHKKNYKEYINQFRINTFLEKAALGETDKKTLLGLAFESGFSSKSTFNQVFKNITGKTPTEYLNQ